MSDPVQIDHEQMLLGLLPGIFRNKTNWPKLIAAWAAPSNELEQVFFDLRNKRDVGSSQGAQVDVLGRIVGEQREGDGDDAYLVRIVARIILNRSNGTGEDIYSIFDVLTGGLAMYLEEFYPASQILHINDFTPLSIPALSNVLQKAKAGGVGTSLHVLATDAADSFSFASGDAVESSVTQGFADDAQTTGGQLSEVYP